MLDVPAGLPPVEGDAAQLQQVLLNLVTNAADAIGDRPGRIRIAAGVEELDADAAAGLRTEAELAPGAYVFLEVQDSGCGIPPDLQGRIFEPFFSTKDTGRGLGLSALLGILRGHKGALHMDSTPGRGTRFRLYFPCGGRPLAQAPRPGAAAAAGAALRILLVDDEDSIRATTAAILERMGHRVETACHGREALELLAGRGPFDLVLLDLMMPEMDGRQALAALRAGHPGLRVVLCSGYTEQELPADWDGVFLAKPYSRETLAAALRRAMDRPV